jgi:hypothetical protein
VAGCRGELQRWPGWQALLQLASRAALVVTEDMPVPPDADWLEALAQQLPPGRGLWAVDTACVVPMQLVKKAYERAGGFRAATEGGLLAAGLQAAVGRCYPCLWQQGGSERPALSSWLGVHDEQRGGVSWERPAAYGALRQLQAESCPHARHRAGVPRRLAPGAHAQHVQRRCRASRDSSSSGSNGSGSGRSSSSSGSSSSGSGSRRTNHNKRRAAGAGAAAGAAGERQRRSSTPAAQQHHCPAALCACRPGLAAAGPLASPRRRPAGVHSAGAGPERAACLPHGRALRQGARGQGPGLAPTIYRALSACCLCHCLRPLSWRTDGVLTAWCRVAPCALGAACTLFKARRAASARRSGGHASAGGRQPGGVRALGGLQARRRPGGVRGAAQQLHAAGRRVQAVRLPPLGHGVALQGGQGGGGWGARLA